MSQNERYGASISHPYRPVVAEEKKVLLTEVPPIPEALEESQLLTEVPPVEESVKKSKKKQLNEEG